MIPESSIDPADVLEMAFGVRPVITHTETISCPECWLIQEATVEHTVPFFTYVHHCRCGFTITESDWEEVCPAEKYAS